MVYRLILLIFFVSGALGLGYQVLWSKFLLDFIGVSAYSYATVLAAFMGGLALGSALLGRFADRARSPLALYAVLELGVGVYALAYLPLTRFVADLYGQWVDYGPDRAGGDVGLWAKVAVSGLLLVPPTFLLGGTFPAMVRHATRHLGVLGRKVSELYALNAFGAVAGTLLMAFVVLPTLGMTASLLLLAAGNLLVAVVSFALAGTASEKRALEASRAQAEAAREGEAPGRAAPATGAAELGAPATEALASAAGPESATTLPPLRPTVVKLALLFVAIEGAISFIYEIAWTRYFGVVLGSSTYSFSIMLAAFITGISLGSALLSRFERRMRNPLAFFGWSQVVVGLLVILPLPLYSYVPGLFLQYANVFSTRELAFYLYELGKLVFCYLFMLPPTILIGMAIPLLVKGLTRDLIRLGNSTGRIYAWNTLGSVVGSLAAGLLLLPALGTEILLAVAALGNGVLGLAAVHFFTDDPARRRRALVAGAPVVAGALLVWLVTPGWDGSWFTLIRHSSGQERSREDVSFRALKRHVSGIKVEMLEDDPAANLMVTRIDGSDGPIYTLYVNGKPDASSEGDLPTQYLSGHLPALFHPDPKDALIIGLASGITAGSMLTYDIERLDIVELLRSMPRAMEYFSPWNEDPLDDPRSHLIVDDARSYLLYTKQQYDIIISEPSNPWMIGTGALFSRDFYERARHALREDGIYLQWIQAYELSDETLAAVLRSFRSVFPHVYGFQGVAADLLLFGTKRPLEPDFDRMAARMREPEVVRQLAAIGAHDLTSFLFLQRFSTRSIDYLASFTSIINTDDNHFLEYRAPRDFFQGLQPLGALGMDERPFASPGLFWSRWIREEGRREFDPIRLLRMVTDERMEHPQVAAAVQLATLHHLGYDEGTIPADQWGLFQDLLVEQEPLSREGLVSRMEALLADGDAALLVDLINLYGHALLLEVAMDPAMASRWLARIDRWSESATDPAVADFVRKLRIDLLLAAGEEDRAAESMVAEVSTPAPLPFGWVMPRACRLTGERAFDSVVDALLRTQPNDVLLRLVEMRSQSAPPGP